MERFYDRMLEMENEIVQYVRESIDTRQKELEQAASKLNYAVADFINRNKTLLARKGNELQRSVKQFSFQKEHDLNKVKHNVKSKVVMWFAVSKTGLTQKRRNLKHAVNESILRQKAVLAHLKDLVMGNSMKLIFSEQERIHFNENTIRLINPENILKRGYTLTLKDGKIVKSTKQININEEIETRFSDGIVKSKIVKKDSYDN